MLCFLLQREERDPTGLAVVWVHVTVTGQQHEFAASFLLI